MRLCLLRRNKIRAKISANPATLPTTLPTTVGVGVLVLLELELVLPAGAVVSAGASALVAAGPPPLDTSDEAGPGRNVEKKGCPGDIDEDDDIVNDDDGDGHANEGLRLDDEAVEVVEVEEVLLWVEKELVDKSVSSKCEHVFRMQRVCLLTCCGGIRTRSGREWSRGWTCARCQF